MPRSPISLSSDPRVFRKHWRYCFVTLALYALTNEWGGATRSAISWESLLSTFWNGVVKPILDALAFSTPGDLSRIFWCPTGPFAFLPIHAAGFYGTQHSLPGHNISDFVVSSYVPTLAILAPSPNPRVEPSGNLRLLAIRQPPSDGQLHLPAVATELGHAREAIKNSPSAHITLLESSDGTVEEVLSLTREADWVHFACHGVQDGVDSRLCLTDQRRLKLVTSSHCHVLMAGLRFSLHVRRRWKKRIFRMKPSILERGCCLSAISLHLVSQGMYMVSCFGMVQGRTIGRLHECCIFDIATRRLSSGFRSSIKRSEDEKKSN
ncbi:hypothetical protein HD554DRAFT_1189286 [Boletus coccyginus]|nr:hypothetical protein HD554DRAFT_1189286 [Boletus coccyginus]